jgi:hypothetical protein
MRVRGRGFDSPHLHRSTPDLFEIDEEFAVITLNAVKE